MNSEERGSKINIEVSKKSDEWLLNTAEEIAKEANARGLKLFFGNVAVETVITNSERDPIETNKLVVEQMGQSFKAYDSIIYLINQSKNNNLIKPVGIHKFKSEFKKWLGEDKLAYINQSMKTDPNLNFTLVATPNIPLTPRQFKDVAIKFGEKNQPYPTHMYIWDELYDQYTPAQISGSKEDSNKVNFSLIPSKSTENMHGTVSYQREMLDKLQQDKPFLRAPSLLEVVAYWISLGTQTGTSKDLDPNIFSKTDMLHFDLPEKRVKDHYLAVPRSYIFSDGNPSFDYSSPGFDCNARVVVG